MSRNSVIVKTVAAAVVSFAVLYTVYRRKDILLRLGWDTTSPDDHVTAANRLKQERRWTEAGEEFEAAAGKCRNELEAANRLNDAATCYRKLDTKNALRCYREAAQMMKELGRFSTAARLYEEAAEMMEQEAGKVEDKNHHLTVAAELYEEAGDTFSDEGSFASSTDCFVRAGSAACRVADFKEAARLFLKACDESVKDEMLRFPAVNHCLKACLTHLLLDGEEAKEVTARLKQKMRQFDGSSELELVDQLLQAETPDQHDKAVEKFNMFNVCDNTVELLLQHLRHRRMGDSPELS